MHRGRSVLAISLISLGWILLTFPADAGGGCHATQAVDAKSTTVEMKDRCFTPAVARINPGDTVTWINQDSITHVVSGTGWGESKDLAGGETMSYRFDTPGIYPYTCYIHPGMNGAVVVGDGAPPQGTLSTGASVQHVLTLSGQSKGEASSVKGQESNREITLPLTTLGLVSVAGAAGYALGAFRRRRTASIDQ
jgi:plastocyanin